MAPSVPHLFGARKRIGKVALDKIAPPGLGHAQVCARYQTGFSMRRFFAVLSLCLSMILPSAPASAQVVDQTFDNAIACALVYRYLGDRGPAYEQLVAKTAQIGGRSVAAIRAELDEREPRLAQGIADGKLDADTLSGLAAKACPNSFGVAPAAPAARIATTGGSSGRPDPYQCAGLFRWLDAKFPSNTWGTTWAGDQMVERAAAALGLSTAALDGRLGSFTPSTGVVATLLDKAVQCQNAYDTPVPPGAVIAAAKYGDRPGVDRGRNQYCQALANDFDRNFPDIGSVERAIAFNPPSGMDQSSKTLENLQYYFKRMDEAQCPVGFTQSRVDAFNELADRATAAIKQAQTRLEREGKWW